MVSIFQLGQDSDSILPLALNDQSSKEFSLKEELIDTSSIHLAEQGAPDDGNVYIIAPKAFK